MKINKVITKNLDTSNVEVFTVEDIITAHGLRINTSKTLSDDLILLVERDRLHGTPLGFNLKMYEGKSLGRLRPIYSSSPTLHTLHVWYGDSRVTTLTKRVWTLREGCANIDFQVRNWKHFWLSINRDLKFSYVRRTGRGNVYTTTS